VTVSTPKVAVDRVDVRVDHATLRIVEVGRGTGYAVRLLGPIDEGWSLRFRNLKTHARIFSRFGLDASTGTVSFSRETTDTPADVIEALQALDTLVARANGVSRS